MSDDAVAVAQGVSPERVQPGSIRHCSSVSLLNTHRSVVLLVPFRDSLMVAPADDWVQIEEALSGDLSLQNRVLQAAKSLSCIICTEKDNVSLQHYKKNDAFASGQ